MNKQAIQPDSVFPPRGAYSHGVRAGNLLFIAGQVARDRDGRLVGPGDGEAQTEQALRNIGAILEAAGASFENVVKLNVYVTDMRHLEGIGRVRRRFMREPFPASTSVQVVGLAEPGLLVEIEAVAAL